MPFWTIVDVETRRVLRYGLDEFPDRQPVGEGEELTGAAVEGFDFTVSREGEVVPFDPGETIAAYEVDEERDRRIAAGLMFEGKLYQTRPADLVNIAGAGTLARFASEAGAQAGDLRWHGGNSDFGWIAMDNSVTPMDAPTVFAFAQAAANRQAEHIFAARSLKNASPIPLNYRADARWPA